ncbi:MAG: hypothetical protein KDD61_14840 [Bdellovibrionales bacterium]|nr:hypothetical protein [Bdellovibrionales bacterium]
MKIVAFKKRDLFLIFVLLFMVLVGVFAGRVDSGETKQKTPLDRPDK